MRSVGLIKNLCLYYHPSDNIALMDLTLDNSWWNSGALWEDRDLQQVKKSSLSYHPRIFQSDELEPGTVYTLRGPRRAGKTVSLKLLIAELIEQQGWPPLSITWSNLETLAGMREMETLLGSIIQERKPRLLVLDEVTSVVGWQRVIKRAVDAGLLSQCCLILTGSSAYDLKKGAERMAGRRGTYKAPDRVLLPMDYAQFCQQLEQKKLTPHPEIYFNVGGFPFRVEEFLKTQGDLEKMSPSTQVFDDIIAYEFNRRKLDRNIALEVLARLATVQAHAISYDAFAKPLHAATNTVRKYLEALGDAYLLCSLSSFDTGRGRPAPRKDRKFLWIDPALAHLAAWLNVGERPREDALAEHSVCGHVIRLVEKQLWEGLSAPRQVFTWKSKAGKEIDLLWVDRTTKKRFPIEVKYQDTISGGDFLSLESSFGRGILITRKQWLEREKTRGIPIGDFLRAPQQYLNAD